VKKLHHIFCFLSAAALEKLIMKPICTNDRVYGVRHQKIKTDWVLDEGVGFDPIETLF
jgi:hypothetical protein